MRYLAIPVLLVLALPAGAQQHHPHVHSQHENLADRVTPMVDQREGVAFPEPMKVHMLANMRDHLLALQEIQLALSKQEYDHAAELAEQRLGMSSLASHGAHEVAKYMPQGMQEAGTAMHRSASRFAMTARDSAATNDVGPALGALADVMASCVTCHAGYRIR